MKTSFYGNGGSPMWSTIQTFTRQSTICCFLKGGWGNSYGDNKRITSCTGMYWAATGVYSKRVYWAVLSCTGLYWAVLGCTWL